MRITNLNPAPDIGASAWLVEIEGHRVLLDAGFHPKLDGQAALPLYGRIGPEGVDAIAISHCHHDHIGSLPVAMRHFPKASVFMSRLSHVLAERVLHNSVNVMLRQRDELGLVEYPLFTHHALDDLASRFQGVRTHREIEWLPNHKLRRGVSSPVIEFLDAGHTLGSAGLSVRAASETLFFTGDVSFRDQTLLKGARFDEVSGGVLLMETTRGGWTVPQDFTREGEIERLLTAIQTTLARKGSVLIPAFALGRTQEILALLALWMRSGALRRQPVYLGGLGKVFSEIYDLQAHETHRDHADLRLQEDLRLIVLSKPEIEEMSLSAGRLFVVTAGMMTDGTAAHDLAVRMSGDERHGIFFVGYADPHTPGGRLKAAKRGETLPFSSSAGDLIRRCEVLEFDLTAHANRNELLEFVERVGPRAVVLGHGEPVLFQRCDVDISLRFPGIQLLTPGPGEVAEF